MKKTLLFAIASVFVLFSCKKEKIIIVKEFIYPTIVGKDTAISGIWDGGGKILRINNSMISANKGGAILQNWVIDGPLTQQIFDTSLQIKNCKTYGQYFSIAWFGAKASKNDNWAEIQKSIVVVMANNLHLWVPEGLYKVSKQLNVESMYQGKYVGCNIKMTGEYKFWSVNNTGSRIISSVESGSAINFQNNKGSSVDGIFFQGTAWKVPTGSDEQYFALTSTTFQDQSGKNIKNSGITVDGKWDGSSIGGSTGISFSNIGVSDFETLIQFSPTGKTANCEDMVIKDCKFGNGKWGFDNGNPQEKNNLLEHVVCWSRLYCFFRNGYGGKQGAGEYTLRNCSVAGHVIRPFEINGSGWSSTYVVDFQAESIRDIGFIYGKFPITIQQSNFKFNLNPTLRKQLKFIGDGYNSVKFRDCTFGFNNGTFDSVFIKYNLIPEINNFENCRSFDNDKFFYKNN